MKKAKKKENRSTKPETHNHRRRYTKSKKADKINSNDMPRFTNGVAEVKCT